MHPVSEHYAEAMPINANPAPAACVRDDLDHPAAPADDELVGLREENARLRARLLEISELLEIRMASKASTFCKLYPVVGIL